MWWGWWIMQFCVILLKKAISGNNHTCSFHFLINYTFLSSCSFDHTRDSNWSWTMLLSIILFLDYSAKYSPVYLHILEGLEKLRTGNAIILEPNKTTSTKINLTVCKVVTVWNSLTNRSRAQVIQITHAE